MFHQVLTANTKRNVRHFLRKIDIYLLVTNCITVIGASLCLLRPPEGPLPFSKFLRVLKPFENLIHLSRARVQHVNLTGPDPPSVRPQWLYVTSKVKKKPLVARTLAQEFSQFGSVDVKILDSQHALVAVAQHRRAKDVLRTFRRHKTLSVRPYNSILDSPKIKIALW